MPKNVMKLLKRSANYGRNAFDLSHRHLFSANFGELLPVTFIETVPGDYFEFRISDLIRAMPMVTSPFMRVKQHFDVWFTPYEDLWSNFESFMVQKTEPRHSNNSMAYKFCPHAKLTDIIEQISQSNISDVVGIDYDKGAKKLFDLCGYGMPNFQVDPANSPSVNLWRIAQYNKVWYEEYRQQYYDDGLRWLTDLHFKYTKNPAALFNFDDLPCDTSANSDIANAASMSITDGFNKLRLREMFQMRYRCWKKDLFTGLMPSTQFGNVSAFVWRNFQVELTTSQPTYIGLDPSTTENVSQVFWNPNGQTIINDRGLRMASGALTTGQSQDSVRVQVRTPHTHSGDATLPDFGFDALDLRKMEAVQIWKERALTAGNRISDNLRAHYGDDVDYNDHRSTFLGSVDAPLNISDVNSTAETGSEVNGALGDVAGKGISSLDEKVFKFKAKKFGCIMVMFSLLPEAEYESYGIDRMNQLLESEDYFVGEYQNLGLEAVSSQTFVSVPNNVARVIGYAPRYYGYKQKLDKVFGGFQADREFAPWASPKTDVVSLLAEPANVLPLSVLYVNPQLFDRNFGMSTDVIDQTICDVYFDCNAVRPMSVTGLPNY